MNPGILQLLMHVLSGGMGQQRQAMPQQQGMGGGVQQGGSGITPIQGPGQMHPLVSLLLGHLLSSSQGGGQRMPGQPQQGQPGKPNQPMQGGIPGAQGFRGAMLGPTRNPNAGGFGGGAASEMTLPGMSQSSQMGGGLFGPTGGLGRMS